MVILSTYLSILQTFRISYGHLVYLLVNWYICFGKYYRENLATLIGIELIFATVLVSIT
jgi:hypothetical protein